MAEQSPQPAVAEEDSPSVEDRLAQYASAPEPEVVEEEQAPEVESAEIEQPADEFEITADDGTPVKIPAKVKDNFLRWDDYTKKTQAVQSLAEKAQDQLHFAEAQTQILTAVAQDIGQYHAVESQLKRYQGLDWQALYSADPGQALKLRDERDQLQAQLVQMGQTIQAKAAHVKNITQQHTQYQWEMAEQGAMKMLGKVTPEENTAMLNTARALGFSEKDLKGRFADARVLVAINKAAKWDMLQAGKSGALNSVNKAPPVVKPGAARGPGAADAAKYQSQRVQLKKTGSIDDAARLLARFK